MHDWSPNQIITFITLMFPLVSSALIPLVYAPRANLRDPLARALLAVTAVVALSFVVRAAVSAAAYSGVDLDIGIWHWSSRVVYISVGVAHLMFLYAMVQVLRRDPKRGRHE